MFRALTLTIILAAVSLPAPAQAQSQTQTLPQARKQFTTKHRSSDFQPADPVPQPPAHIFRRIRYTSPAGKLVACITPDPGDGKRRPAILWCHGGWGGIGEYYWTPQPPANDQTPKAFIDAGFVVMLPAWRGENDNPGQYEMFLGEVDDALAALDLLRSMPYVDPSRVYVVGHSTGGTIALLTALSTDKVRAAFCFGASPDLRAVAKSWANMLPFNPKEPNELKMRSAIDFIHTLKTPTWYIEGESSAHVPQAKRLQEKASAAKVPLNTAIIAGGDHFNILRPVNAYLAKRLKEDTGARFGLTFTPQEFQSAYDTYNQARIARRKLMPPPRLTGPAAKTVKRLAAEQKFKPNAWWLEVTPGKINLIATIDPEKHETAEHLEVPIAMKTDSADEVRGVIIDYVPDGASKGFKFIQPNDEP